MSDNSSEVDPNERIYIVRSKEVYALIIGCLVGFISFLVFIIILVMTVQKQDILEDRAKGLRGLDSISQEELDKEIEKRHFYERLRNQ